MGRGDVNIKITGDISGLNRALTGGAARIDTFGTKAKEGLAKAAPMAGKLALGLIGVGIAATKTAGDYQQTMGQLQTVTKSTDAQMAALSTTARQLGSDTHLSGTSAKDAAEAMLELSKAGLTVKETQESARAALVLSAATGIDNARAAEIAANALNQFHLKATDMTHSVNTLGKAANASSLDITDVAESLKYVGTSWSQAQNGTVGAQKAFDQVNVALAILGDRGIKGSMAGTSLNQMMSALQAPTLKGGAALDQLNIRLEKMHPEMAKGGGIVYDAAGKMRAFPEILDRITKSMGNMTQAEEAGYTKVIFTTNARRSAQTLMAGGLPVWNQYTQKVKDAASTEDMAASKMKGMKGQLDVLQGAAQELAIALGQQVIPAVVSIAQVVVKFLGVLSGAPGITGPVLLGVLALAAGVWTVNKAISAWEATMKATRAILAVASAMTNGWTLAIVRQTVATAAAKVAQVAVNAATKAWAAAQWLLNAALDANPIGVVVVAVAALAAGIVYAYRHSETFRKIVGALGKAAVATFGAIKDAVMWVINAISDAIAWVDKLLAKVGGAKILIPGIGPILAGLDAVGITGNAQGGTMPAGGGWVRRRVGELGAENVLLPPGAKVGQASDSTGGMGGGGVVFTGPVTLGSRADALILGDRIAARMSGLL